MVGVKQSNSRNLFKCSNNVENAQFTSLPSQYCIFRLLKFNILHENIIFAPEKVPINLKFISDLQPFVEKYFFRNFSFGIVFDLAIKFGLKTSDDTSW